LVQDWDDKEYIDDPSDSKPADWDKPEHIPDPEAKKPEVRIIHNTMSQVTIVIIYRIGMMRWTANGNHHRQTTQNTRENGNQNKSRMKRTKAFGYIQKSTIPNTNPTTNCTCTKTQAPLV
jgi:hypothetical protein